MSSEEKSDLEKDWERNKEKIKATIGSFLIIALTGLTPPITITIIALVPDIWAGFLVSIWSAFTVVMSVVIVSFLGYKKDFGTSVPEIDPPHQDPLYTSQEQNSKNL